MHYPIPKVLATESKGSTGYNEVMCVSRKHALLVVQEEHYDPPCYLVAYNVSDPASPAPMWRKEVDRLSSCAATEDVVLLTLYASGPKNVTVVDVTTGQKTDTIVVDSRLWWSVGVSKGYLFFSYESDVQAFHISESLQAEPLPDLRMNSSMGNYAHGTDTSMCVDQYYSKSRPGRLSIFMYDTWRSSLHLSHPAPATPAPVTPAPDTPAGGVPWLVVVGSVVFFAAAGLAGGWFLKSKMKVHEVDQNSGLCDQIVNDSVEVEFSAFNIAE